MSIPTRFSFDVQPEEGGARLDHFLVRHLPDHSRSSLGKHIRSGHILVNSNQVKPGVKLHLGDIVTVELPAPEKSGLVAQPVDFLILFEDEGLLVISKPPGLVVHPAAGHADSTLVNGLLHRYAHLPGESSRPGIVHRLDKDTSGIMLVAKTEKMLRLLAAAFKERRIHKTYHALLLRCPKDMAGRVVAPIGRHPVNRKKMAIRNVSGRYAATSWKIVEQFPLSSTSLCLAEIIIETGRTHQIRVHLASVGSPVAGDILYGGKVADKAGVRIDRQFLHASTISFIHPETGDDCSFTAPLWEDMALALKQLRGDEASKDKEL